MRQHICAADLNILRRTIDLGALVINSSSVGSSSTGWALAIHTRLPTLSVARSAAGWA
jgi:hypothetical protein